MEESGQQSLTPPVLKDMWVRLSITLEESAFSSLVVFQDSVFSQIMMQMGGKWFFPVNDNLLIGGIKPVPEQLITTSFTILFTVQGKPNP